jgi:hypothetical protein
LPLKADDLPVEVPEAEVESLPPPNTGPALS